VPTRCPGSWRRTQSLPPCLKPYLNLPRLPPIALCRLNRRRTVSVDFTSQPGVAAAAAEEEQCQDDDIASTPVISAASSLLGHHLGGALAGATTTPGTATAAASSASGSPLFGGAGGVAFGSGCGLGPRAQSASRDLFVAQADAVMAHAQVQTLQTALRKVCCLPVDKTPPRQHAAHERRHCWMIRVHCQLSWCLLAGKQNRPGGAGWLKFLPC
jgi:hypothetical protein